MPYHKVRKDGTIRIESESPKTVLFFTGLGLLIATLCPWLIVLWKTHSVDSADLFWFGGGVIFSLLIFIPSFFLKPIFTVFDPRTGRAYFHSGKRNFDVPFSAIVFEGAGTPSATYRMRYHVVSIYAISEKPMFPGQKIINPLEPARYYKTLLGTYRCSSREQAEESIEQLLRFMGALPQEPADPLKFDNLV